MAYGGLDWEQRRGGKERKGGVYVCLGGGYDSYEGLGGN
jgi:hypothetical protein